MSRANSLEFFSAPPPSPLLAREHAEALKEKINPIGLIDGVVGVGAVPRLKTFDSKPLWIITPWGEKERENYPLLRSHIVN